MKKSVIVSAARTAVGAYLGGLKEVPVEVLASTAIREALKRAKITGNDVDDVILGHVISSTDAPNLARTAALLLGIESAPGLTLNRLCGSGIQAVISAAQEIETGGAEVVVAGGAESLSRVPYYLPLSVRYQPFRNGSKQLFCANEMAHLNAQPAPLYPAVHMGITAENVVARYNISREDQDLFAFHSQMKAKAAMESGRFAKEIVPVAIESKKGTIMFDTDEHPRPETTMEGLAKVRPAFKKDGTVTAGNASGMNDGGAALVIMSAEMAKAQGLKPLAAVVDYAVTALDPMVMGLGPVSAIRKLLKKTCLTLDDIDLVEINEAFAGQTLGCLKELGMYLGTSLYERLNVNGGAVALGHPLGMSGARLVTTLAYELQIRKARYGIASACIGGGQGIALLIENGGD
ncbi:MAG TPA: thiolase family protein [Negativicutes bacterium]|nr:thiolase family protein [Negativicutes bacterium]